jgi:phage terminase small subunit
MARHPTPTSLKILRGNPGNRPLNDAEPVPPPANLTPPRNLTGLALEKWVEMAELLFSMGVFTQADRHPLERYCLMYEQWQNLEAHCRQCSITSAGTNMCAHEASHILRFSVTMHPLNAVYIASKSRAHV